MKGIKRITDDHLPGGNNKKILVIDDNSTIRDLLSKTLSYMGFTVAVACSGNEGLDLFLKDPFDLVLTDFQMPGMDGGELTYYVKDRVPTTPVVMITGQQKEEVSENDKCGCVDSVMFKPFSLKEMEKTIHRMLGARS